MVYKDISDVESAHGLYLLGEKACHAQITGDIASLSFEQTMRYYQSIGGELDVSEAQINAALLLYRFVEFSPQYKPHLFRVTEYVMMQVADVAATGPLRAVVMFLAELGNWVDSALVMATRVNAARITPPIMHSVKVLQQRIVVIGKRRYMLLDDLRRSMPISLPALSALRSVAEKAAPHGTFVCMGHERVLELHGQYSFLREHLTHRSDVWLVSKRGCSDIVDLLDPENADEIKALIHAAFVVPKLALSYSAKAKALRMGFRAV